MVIEMELYCEKCKESRYHAISPWQFEAGKFNGISIMCNECADMHLLRITSGIRFDPGGMKDD